MALRFWTGRASTEISKNASVLTPDEKTGIMSRQEEGTHMSYSLNSLKGGYMGDYIGDYYRAY